MSWKVPKVKLKKVRAGGRRGGDLTGSEPAERQKMAWRNWQKMTY